MQFFIEGVPTAQKVSHTILFELHDLIPIERGVWLQIAIYLPRARNTPKSVKLHTKNPKLSMLTDEVIEGVLRTKLIRRPEQIGILHAYKGYATDRKPMGCELNISELLD